MLELIVIIVSVLHVVALFVWAYFGQKKDLQEAKKQQNEYGVRYDTYTIERIQGVNEVFELPYPVGITGNPSDPDFIIKVLKKAFDKE